MSEHTTNHKKQAALLSIIPGIGQFYNKQAIKGIVFLTIFIAFVIQMVIFGVGALEGLVTLGTTPREDNSLFMLVEGALQVIISLIFIFVYIINIKDAYKVGEARDQGKKVPTKTVDTLKHIWEHGFPFIFITPAYIIMAFVILFPVLVTLLVAFTNYDFRNIPPNSVLDWVGFENFTKLFRVSSYRATFTAILKWTFIWTFGATTLQIVIGVVTAVVLNQKHVKGKAFFRILFLLPWAVPAFITIMTFSNMFNDSIGAINTQVIPFLNNLPFVDIPSMAWKTDTTWARVALIMIQGWLGFPYIFVMVTGVLQSISEDLYEAASLDGANAIQQFRKITLPMILFATAPVMITQYTFNFNNFSVIYLFNEGGPGNIGWSAGSTDILISWIYSLTTGQSPQYALGAAVTLIISFIVIGISLFTFKKTNAFGNEEMM